MNTQEKTTEMFLASGLKLRSAQWADLEPVAQLILDVCTADGDPAVAMTLEEIEREWKTPGFELEKDTWIVAAPGGRIIGYELFLEQHAHAALIGEGYVHPEYQGRGIGTTLLRALEARAHEEMKLAEPDLRVFIRNVLITADTTGRQLHEAEGYRAVRFSWRMEIKLDDAPRTPVWPAGIELRPFVKELHDYRLFEADDEVFRDNWGSAPWTFEHWQHDMSGSEDFDPSLWFIAWDGDEIAGYSLCRDRKGIGWVSVLGVRRPWRKRGLGEALLLHSFGEFYQRGTTTIGLFVETENSSGATRLYKKAGMQAAAEYVFYEKELRPGREPVEQEE